MNTLHIGKTCAKFFFSVSVLVLFSAVHAFAAGALTVTIAPQSAVDSAAQWSVDGGATWHNSGDTVAGLSAGDVTLEFSAVAGWESPASRAVTIVDTQTAEAAGIYLHTTLTNLESLHAGNYTSLLLKADGTVWTWGRNEYGQLGDGTIGDSYSKSIPVPVLNDDSTRFDGVVSAGLGYSHAVALKTDGTVWSWGENYNNQRGDGTAFSGPVAHPVQVLSGYQTPLTGIVAISVGENHTQAIKADGTLWAWGDSGYGQVGDGYTIDRYWAVQVRQADTSPFTDAVAVEAGKSHTLALRSDGTVWAWGYNGSGQLGDGQSCGSGNCVSPVQVVNADLSPFTGVVDIAVGYEHSLALKADGTLWAWGNNFHGELGDGTNSRRYNPVQVVNADSSSFTGVADIVSTSENSFSVALKADGTVWTWGYNDNGQLGDGTTMERWNPVQVVNPDSSPFADVAAAAAKNGAQHTLARKMDGTLWAWGNAYFGQLGNGGSGGQPYNYDAGIDQPNPVPVQWTGALTVTLVPAEAIAAGAQWRVDGGAWTDSGQSVTDLAGGYHTLEFSLVTGWRSPLVQQVVVGALNNSAVGIYLSETAVESVKGGNQHTTALRHDGSVWAWGYNSYGELGDGQSCGTGNCPAPVQVVNGDSSPFTGTVKIDSGGGEHVLAVKADGTLWAWGNNNAGKLGDGTLTNRTTPVQVKNADGSAFTDVVAAAAGGTHSLALKSDGTLWAWGANYKGQIGIGTYGNGSNWRNPLQVINTDGSPFTGVVAIDAGSDHNLVLRGDGTVWAWGDNIYKQSGDGVGGSYRLNPVQVKNYDSSPLTDVSAIAAGRFHNVVLKSDGSVWGWGADNSGQLGIGNTSTLSNPAQAKINSTTYFSGADAIATGYDHTLARKADGTLWAWGYNSQGALGDGQACGTGNCLYATQVKYVDGTDFTDISCIAAGSGHALAELTNGAVWSWGYNGDGQLGDGTSGAGTQKYNPVLAGGFTTHNGSLQVNIEPQASRDAGAQWQVDGGVWMNSGDIVAGLTPGDHTVVFSDVSGQIKPDYITAAITDGQVTVKTGTYNVEADLSISKTDGQNSAVPGTSTTYTITVSNAGPNNVTGAEVTDTLPGILSGASWTCTASLGSTCTASGSGSISDSSVDLLSGGTATYTVSATIAASATGILVNTASVVVPGTVTDPNSSNNSATDNDTLTPQADIAVVKIESADPVIAGSGTGNLFYTVTVTNNGPSDASGVIIGEDMTLPAGVVVNAATPSLGTYASPLPPDGTWTLGSLASGADATLTVTLTVGASAQTGNNSIVNTAALVGVDGTDTNSANNSATVATSVCANVYYRDADGDGYGDPGDSLLACTQPAGYVVNNTDCNDSDPDQKPGQKWYPDADNDGYGAASGPPVIACSKQAGTAADKTDCNDNNSSVNPGKYEGPRNNPVCSDNLDNDCDGTIDIKDQGCAVNNMAWFLLLLRD